MFAPNPPPSDGVGGGGANKKYRFSRVREMSDIWNFYPIKTPNPWWAGVGLICFITFLGSSWHFPDFWFFYPLKFPLRPPLGWGGPFFLGRNHSQICRDLCILNPFSDLFFCIQRHNIPSFCRLCISSLGNNMAPWTTWPDFSWTAHDATLLIHADCRRMWYSWVLMYGWGYWVKITAGKKTAAVLRRRRSRSLTWNRGQA